MKTSVWVYAAFFFISILLVSCQEEPGDLSAIFSKAEMCMDNYPDSALYLLNLIPNPELLRDKSQADYALLMTQAADKSYKSFSSDSLIVLALNYYTHDKNEPALLAKTQYYYGRVMQELKREDEALVSFLAAKKYFESIRDYKMLASIAEEMGMIYRRKKVYGEALKNYQEAFTIQKHLNDSLGMVEASQNIARVFLFENKWDSSHYYYNYALEIIIKNKYPFEVSILHELGILYRSMRKLKAAEPYFRAAYEKETDKEKKYMECLSLGYLYMQMGRVKEAKKYFLLCVKSSETYTRIDAFNCLYFLEKDIHNLEEAIVYHEKADSITNAVETVNSCELIEKLQKQYESEKLRNDNLQMKMRYTNFVLWSMLAFLVVAFYMCYYYYKNKNHRKRIADIECQIRRNEDEIKRYQLEVEEAQRSKEEILEENRMLEENRVKIGELNGKIMLLAMQNKHLSGLLKKVGGELTIGPSSEQYIPAFRLLLALKEGAVRGKLTTEERERLFSLFDLLYSNYISRLLEQNPSLTKHDLEICCLLKLGLTNEELSHIFHTTSDSVTKAKGRLKGRLGISSQDDLAVFLREF